jgi:hypothetical protein
MQRNYPAIDRHGAASSSHRIAARLWDEEIDLAHSALLLVFFEFATKG